MIRDVAVIGAGIVGAACAVECAQSGLNVVVLDPGEVGGGATAAGMGHIVVMDDSEAQFALTAYSQRLWNELMPTLPADVEVFHCGSLWVAADAAEMDEVHRKERYYRERGVTTQILDAAQLVRVEPNLRPGLAGGLRVPGDSVIYPPCAVRTLLERFAIPIHNRRVLGRLAGKLRLDDGTELAARFAVNATGSWAPELAPGIEVRKRKGHLLITDRYPGYLRHQVIELGYLKSAHKTGGDSVAFNVQPRPNGQLLIGSSRQYGAETTAVEPAMLGQMLRRAVEYMPGIERLSALRAWTGFRAATPDKLPLIGPVPGDDGFFLATGHEGLGITTSLGTAKLLVDQILGRKPAIPWEPYLPGRFQAGVRHG